MKTKINTKKKHKGYLNFLILFLIAAFIGCGNVTESFEKPEAPVASFHYDMGQSLTVQFDGSGSSDPDGRIASYRWDFGDDTTEVGAMLSHPYNEAGTTGSSAMLRSTYNETGLTETHAMPSHTYIAADTTGSGATPSHTYSEAGTYTVTLTVTDNDGVSDTASQQVSVQAPNQAPSAAFTFTVTDLLAEFDAGGSNDADGSIASYRWDFGDGASGAGVTPQHIYSKAGTYTVMLTVTDNDRASDTVRRRVTVEAPNQRPSASFTFDKDDLSVRFDGGGSSDGDGRIVSYRWDFGDRSSGSRESPRHTYSEAGTYTVTLTVTDDEGATDTASQQVTVETPNQAPSATFTFTATGLFVQFDGSGSSDPDGSIDSYSWDFGDGTSGSGESPQHTYSEAGTYTVMLTVTDNDGVSDTASQQVTVEDSLMLARSIYLYRKRHDGSAYTSNNLGGEK